MASSYKVERFGWIPDIPDHRDYIYHERNSMLGVEQLPASCDLIKWLPPIYNQLQLGACTGNGWARVMETMAKKQNLPAVTPSRLFIYFNERVIENTVSIDSGAQVRDGAKVVSSLGVPPESDWPYDPSKFAERPPESAYKVAVKDEALVYERVIPDSAHAVLRNVLVQGYPIVFGFSVPDYFEGGWDPTTPLPPPGPNDEIIGGHCVVMTGYDFSRSKYPVDVFQIDNSWGRDWGIGGRFMMQANWFANNSPLVSDFWIVRKVS